MSSAAAGAEQHRAVRLSTVCLLDGAQYQTRDYALGVVADACRRAENDLVVVPYMPFLSFDATRAEADLAPFAALARAQGTYLSVALKEQADGKTYATSVLLDRQGKLAFRWRKTHAFPDDDGLALGDSLEVCRTDFGVLGATIGTDFYFPEVYEVLRMKGADILLWQDFPERFRDHSGWEPLLQARAFDSHVHLVAAMYADPRAYLTNRYEIGMQGTAFGRSMILNRVGCPVADTGYEDGVATATVDLDKRKVDMGDGWERGENLFYVNSLGDRTAFKPVSEPWSASDTWQPPKLPAFRKRTARLAVIAMDPANMWSNGKLPDRLFELLDEAAKLDPDLVLLSEQGAKEEDETTRKAFAMVAERARKMKAYVCIGGLGSKEQMSIARIWDREGNEVYGQPLYWVKGFPELKVLDTDFARIACHSCGDLYSPMFDRTLAVKGAELILDPSQMWGPNGRVNETLLRARAIDNGVWVACAHWNSSDPSLRSLIVDPYGQVMAASKFQQEGVFWVDLDFDNKRVYYEGKKAEQPKRGETGIPSYYTEDIPEQKPGWREMMLARRRPELYGIIPTVNEVTMKYRPAESPFEQQ
jgi:predicted amidohydrolase